MPKDYLVLPNRVRFYPLFQRASGFGKILFQGSSDGITYTTTNSGYKANGGWNLISAPVTATSWYSYLRFIANDATDISHCYLAEVAFYGTIASKLEICPVNVTIASSTLNVTSRYHKLIAGQVSYRNSIANTSVVHTISPSSGTSLGGTLVTLQGANLCRY